MSRESDEDTDLIENVSEVMDGLMKELRELYVFRDMFFENHPIEMATEKNKLVQEKQKVLLEKFEKINDDKHIPNSERATFLYMKGRCYNICTEYNPLATQCLSKAVKLNPHLVDAWNELGECYWKNMNIKEAKSSFEGALKHERNRISLRSLSILMRQDKSDADPDEAEAAILKSVDLAKEAVALDTKDGMSWIVLGNSYLCQFFMVAQETKVLQSCMRAYKQALVDPVAKGQPDLYHNKGIALKYEEQYAEALENFQYASRLDPLWEYPQQEISKLTHYLTNTSELVRTRGKIKVKKLTQMAQSIDKKMLGIYGPGTLHTFKNRRDVLLEDVTLASLQEGTNEGKVILAKVIGSIHTENAVQFTFAIVDANMECAAVTVYNWADGRGAIIGDCVCIPEPKVILHQHQSDAVTHCMDTGPLLVNEGGLGSSPPRLPNADWWTKYKKYNYKAIRVNNPMNLLLNGKKVGRNQFSSTQVTSTYEIN